jgi:hypothetical protein
MKDKIKTLVEEYISDKNKAGELYSKLEELFDDNQELTTIDRFAVEIVKSEVISWNTEMSKEHRELILQDMINRYGGKTTLNDCIANMSYELAESMMKVRKNFKK